MRIDLSLTDLLLMEQIEVGNSRYIGTSLLSSYVINQKAREGKQSGGVVI
jgi:hypothetical protein